MEYAIAFERDMAPEIQNAIRKQQRRIDLIYSSMELSFLLNRLRNAVELKGFVHFNEVDELNGQYREITMARKHLFDDDITYVACSIDLTQDVDYSREMAWTGTFLKDLFAED